LTFALNDNSYLKKNIRENRKGNKELTIHRKKDDTERR